MRKKSPHQDPLGQLLSTILITPIRTAPYSLIRVRVRALQSVGFLLLTPYCIQPLGNDKRFYTTSSRQHHTVQPYMAIVFILDLSISTAVCLDARRQIAPQKYHRCSGAVGMWSAGWFFSQGNDFNYISHTPRPRWENKELVKINAEVDKPRLTLIENRSRGPTRVREHHLSLF